MRWPAPVREGIWPFRDQVYEEAGRKAAEPYMHLSLDEALKKIREDREKGIIK